MAHTRGLSFRLVTPSSSLLSLRLRPGLGVPCTAGSNVDDGMTDRGRVRVADTGRVIGRPPGGRPPSRGHEGRLVSQTQRALELTECSPRPTTATSRQCFFCASAYIPPRATNTLYLHCRPFSLSSKLLSCPSHSATSSSRRSLLSSKRDLKWNAKSHFYFPRLGVAGCGSPLETVGHKSSAFIISFYCFTICCYYYRYIVSHNLCFYLECLWCDRDCGHYYNDVHDDLLDRIWHFSR